MPIQDPREMILDKISEALSLCYLAGTTQDMAAQTKRLEEISEEMFQDWIDNTPDWKG